MCADKLNLWIYLQVEKPMYMEPRKKTRELKSMIRSSVNSLLQHTACCFSQISVKVLLNQVTWLARDFSTYFGHNWGVSY